tara:strand:+ start:1161 stop:2030 length:870 start_codon:yes stop_codon:yes gene_type:complete
MSIFDQLFKGNSDEQEPGFFKVEGSELTKFDPSTETKSINDAINELGFDTTQIHTLHTDYFDCIGVRIFTKDPVLVLTLDKKTVNSKILQRELKKVDWDFEYSSHTVEDILTEGIENHSLTFDYLSSVLKLNKESDSLFIATDFGLYLTFKNGYLESFGSSDWTNAASKWIKEANQELFDTMLSEALQFHKNELEAMEEVNFLCEAFQNIPYGTKNEFIPLHRKTNGTINYFNLLAAHYNNFNEDRIKIDDFKTVNKGRFISRGELTFEVDQFIYQFDIDGLLTGSTRK